MEIKNYTNLLALDESRLITLYKAKSVQQEHDVQLNIIPSSNLENRDTSLLPDNHTLFQWDHPYIAKIYDSGITFNNDYYLATEYFPRGSLAEKINHKALSIQESIVILEQLVTGLDYLHKQEFIHYQLRPETIKFRENGDAIIADFALAEWHYKITATTPPILLQDDLRYMCPEEAQTAPLTLRADIYKLALITYEMLSGKAVCTATTSIQALYQHAVSSPPELPKKYAALQKVFNKGLAKKPEERHASAFHFLTALKIASQKIGKKPANIPQKITKKTKAVTTQASHHLKSGRPRLSADQAVSARGEHELAYSYDDKPKTPLWRSKKTMGIAAVLLLSTIGSSLYFINSTKKLDATTSKDPDQTQQTKSQASNALQDNTLTNQSDIEKKSLTTKISIHTLSNSDKKPIKATFLLKLKNGNILGTAIKEVTSTSYNLFPATYHVIIKYQNLPEIIKTIIVNDKAQQIFISIDTDEAEDTSLTDTSAKNTEIEESFSPTLIKDEGIKLSQ